MFSSPVPIFFSTELEAPPIKELAIPRDAARRLYVKLNEPTGCRYENIDTQATNPILSTRRGEEGRSSCLVGRNMIRIEELNPEMPVDEFVNVVKTILAALGEDFRPFFFQKVKIQCLSQPNVLQDPLGILVARIGNVGNKIEPFGRPPTFFGVRFRFAPWQPGEESEDDEANESDGGNVNCVRLDCCGRSIERQGAGKVGTCEVGDLRARRVSE